VIPKINSKAVLFQKWYQKNKRDLPWRKSQNPYKVWVSEIILQQTRVDQGLLFFNRFLKRFSDLRTLASASEEEVLKSWEGMGYYSRARNLHKAARILVNEKNGVFPKEPKELEKLPGIGPYTSAAIASICYGKEVLACDGNVVRVISRIFGIKGFRTEKGFSDILEKRSREIFFRPSSDFNQALMDFGSLQCIPTNPNCQKCLFNDMCFANINGELKKYPSKKVKKASKERYLYYLVLEENGEFWFRKRIENDIWANLYEFPKIEKEKAMSSSKILKEVGLSPKKLKEETGFIKHILSHQIIYANFLILHPDTTLKNGVNNSTFGERQSKKEVLNLPFPRLITNFLEERYSIYGRSK
jgi:A/G-specific adenine glycosylase